MTPLPPALRRNRIPQARHVLQCSRALSEAFKYHRSGNLSQAETIYRALLRMDGNHADLLHLLGVIAHQTGSSEAALALIDRAIARRNCRRLSQQSRPCRVASRSGRGCLDRFRSGHCLARRLRRRPFESGKRAIESNRIGEAIKSYADALVLNPRHAEAHNNLGNVLRRAASCALSTAGGRRSCCRPAIRRRWPISPAP